MSKVRVAAFAISADGFGAGPSQDMKNPLGVAGESLHEWFFPTRTFRMQHTEHKDGTTGIDDDFARASMENVGAWILGRNMFAPSRGPWPDDSWKGWWGDDPPYHVPTFILTHHPHAPIEMKGGTTFHFVGSLDEALRRAKEAAGVRDVRIGGGVSTVRQYLEKRVIDEMHLVVSPVVLGAGERFWSGLDLAGLGHALKKHVMSEAAMHLVFGRR
ncbi:MAG: dihydrofolate reductase family protein [Myxococcales bacterium]